jgi:hypothetical protein
MDRDPFSQRSGLVAIGAGESAWPPLGRRPTRINHGKARRKECYSAEEANEEAKMISLLKQSARALGVAIVFIGCSAAADTLPTPQERSILGITGKISNTNAGNRAEFDVPMLEKIGISRLKTTTAWTEGRPVFEGVLVRDLLNLVGASGDKVTVVALNDYKVDIPMSDFKNYPVILAYRMDGQALRIKDKGPLWIIYPADDFPELNNKQTQNKWVWQVKEIQIN